MTSEKPRLFSRTRLKRWNKGKSQFIFRSRGIDYSLTVNPYIAPLLVMLTFGFMFASLIAGSYNFLRDDIHASQKQWREAVVISYEQRITELRKQVDIAVSKQVLIQKSMEERVARLLEKQRELSLRSDTLRSRINPIQDKRASLLDAPALKNTELNWQTAEIASSSGLRLGSFQSQAATNSGVNTETTQIAIVGDDVFETLEAALARSEQEQLNVLAKASTHAQEKTRRLAAILKKQGVDLGGSAGVGGPLIQLKGADHFTEKVQALDERLNTLDRVRVAATYLPHGSPVKKMRISSRFGRRKDPFTGGSAMHGGLDFRARRGTPVLATAAGTVVKAGRQGGYGKLVEIDHGGGITTRYAHLHRIHVKVGDKIKRMAKIGQVGSTGRSTGPHLHYEVRRKGRVLNPITYVKLAEKLKPYL